MVVNGTYPRLIRFPHARFTWNTTAETSTGRCVRAVSRETRSHRAISRLPAGRIGPPPILSEAFLRAAAGPRAPRHSGVLLDHPFRGAHGAFGGAARDDRAARDTDRRGYARSRARRCHYGHARAWHRRRPDRSVPRRPAH